MFSRVVVAIADTIDCLNEWIGRALSWLSLAMVLATFSIVVLRYAFNVGWIAMQESVTWMYALLFLLGAAYTLKHDAHVRVDILYQRCSPALRAWIDLLGVLFLLLPVCLLILWSGWDYVARAWAIAEGSREVGGLPALYLLKTAILVMALLLLLQGLSLGLRCIMTITDGSVHPGRSA